MQLKHWSDHNKFCHLLINTIHLRFTVFKSFILRDSGFEKYPFFWYFAKVHLIFTFAQ